MSNLLSRKLSAPLDNSNLEQKVMVLLKNSHFPKSEQSNRSHSSIGHKNSKILSRASSVQRVRNFGE